MYKSCFQIAAGKKATADGSVMVARSCDSMGDHAVQVVAVPHKKRKEKEIIKIKNDLLNEPVKIPQINETYSYISVITRHEMESNISESMGGINEFQVSAGSSSGGQINSKAANVLPVIPTSLGDYRTTFVLERCKTAREGIKLTGELTEKYGARGDYYIIADPKEVWYYEEYYGNLWAAVRIPDDSFIISANHSRIKEVNLKDTKNYLGAKNIIDFAIENNLYNPDDGEPFNAMKAYGNHQHKMKRGKKINYNGLREWRGISLLAPSTKLKPEESVYKYPLYTKPDKKLTPKFLLSVFMDHYHGTEFDCYGKEENYYQAGETKSHSFFQHKTIKDPLLLNKKFKYRLSPTWNPIRNIGTPRAITTWCAQLRDWMPNTIGGLLWAGIGEGSTSGHVPYYVGVTKTPEAYNIGSQKVYPWEPFTEGSTYSEDSAYWRFRELSNLVNLFYDSTEKRVIPIWRGWEEKMYNLQNTIEETALLLHKQNPDLAIDFLTSYSNSKAIEAFEMAKEMIRQLHTIIAHYNGPI